MFELNTCIIYGQNSFKAILVMTCLMLGHLLLVFTNKDIIRRRTFQLATLGEAYRQPRDRIINKNPLKH